MKTVKVFGYSDDNIEIRGDLGTDEFGAYGGWKYLHFYDGTIVKGGYSLIDGKGWHFEVVKYGEGASEHFSDVLEITGSFNRVDCWDSESGPNARQLIEAIEERVSSGGASHAQLVAAHRALFV